ncbi:DUF4231 domain-containing protein [Helicobacter trogontum]|uniref:Uncharacterized protein n=1 Tax=Helicobacter trogontum TaxID=50960 RepID=A0A4U8SDU8_9HELI|nr:DUF4231 domain-containing protein [Helicobacter trogontum]TLD84251.1 hypothetical protein LS81_001945 [Helicobacter trogontum]
MQTQSTYRTKLEAIDKDIIASMFMAACELNEVYNEEAYYLFLSSFILNSNDLALIEEEAQFLTEKEIQIQLIEIEVWYNNQFIIDSESKTRRPKDEWYPAIGVGEDSYSGSITDALRVLNTEKAKKIQAIQDNKDNIKQNNVKKLKKNKIVNDWIYIGEKNVFDTHLKYQSTWTYNDVLLYFKEYGFPLKRLTQIQELENNLNVCRVRHILRNDIMIDEAILLALLEMQERKSHFEKVADDKKFWQIFMIIVGAIVSVVSLPFSFGQSLWIFIPAIVSAVAGVSSSIVGGVNMILDSINATELKEITQQTNDLMLKNMPHTANFIDTTITDPYAMYANGRLWEQGGAGKERYDAIKVHEPYNALDDTFGDSSMYDALNYKNSGEKKAGGEQYLSNLYRDGKWSNPSSFKTLLNGEIPIYLSMRNKVVETCFKWLTQNDLGTYYLYEDNPEDSKKNIDRYHAIEFEHVNDVMGFTDIIAKYKYVDDFGTMAIVGYIHDVSTSWDKQEDEKTQTKNHNITEHANIISLGIKKEVLQGKDIDIFVFIDSTNKIPIRSEASFPKQNSGTKYYHIMKPIKDVLEHGNRIVDENLFYECEYELYNYGGKEVRYYTSIKERDKQYILPITSIEIEALKCYKYFIREEAKARIRFKARTCSINYANKDFRREELQTECKPYIVTEEMNMHVYRYFDRNTKFAELSILDYALSEIASNGFVEVTIYHKNNDEITMLGADFIDGTTYFGISPFLSAQRSITAF